MADGTAGPEARVLRGNATTEIFIPDRLIVRLKILAVDSWLCDGYIIWNLIVMLYKA